MKTTTPTRRAMLRAMLLRETVRRWHEEMFLPVPPPAAENTVTPEQTVAEAEALNSITILMPPEPDPDPRFEKYWAAIQAEVERAERVWSDYNRRINDIIAKRI